jgi:hypothetical protein
MNKAEKVAEYLKQGGLLANWQQVTVAMQAPHHAVATVRYADSGPRQWHVLSKDGFTNEALWNVYEVKLPQDSPADHFADAGKMVETRWIPVSERLPDQHKEVIGWWGDTPQPHAGFAWIDDNGVWNSDSEYPDPTHWMPLPGPPTDRT